MLKRLLDILFSAAGLLVLSPVFLLLAIIIRVRLGSPVFFRQRRPGLNAKPFNLIKFRTMLDGVDADGNILSDELRLTPFSRWLRSTSLDEIPELWNVLVGDMSIVGPRPLLMEYLPRYNDKQRRRHDVRPGLTGWAQVNGRNDISWAEKFELDVWYVENQSILLDLRVCLRTLGVLFSRAGVSKSGHATSDAFMGNDHNDSGNGRSSRNRLQ